MKISRNQLLKHLAAKGDIRAKALLASMSPASYVNSQRRSASNVSFNRLSMDSASNCNDYFASCCGCCGNVCPDSVTVTFENVVVQTCGCYNLAPPPTSPIPNMIIGSFQTTDLDTGEINQTFNLSRIGDVEVDGRTVCQYEYDYEYTDIATYTLYDETDASCVTEALQLTLDGGYVFAAFYQDTQELLQVSYQAFGNAPWYYVNSANRFSVSNPFVFVGDLSGHSVGDTVDNIFNDCSMTFPAGPGFDRQGLDPADGGTAVVAAV